MTAAAAAAVAAAAAQLHTRALQYPRAGTKDESELTERSYTQAIAMVSTEETTGAGDAKVSHQPSHGN